VSSFKKIILFIISAIGVLLAAKSVKKRKVYSKIAKNDAEVKRLGSQIQEVKAEKEILNNELTELTKIADGRSKQVKNAKQNVKKNDQSIADLEAALAEAEKNL
jgi:peptidoglycan hydrolase CwlO-like protein|tara:strand:+ start:600 stop:911 length:312 start_codon:yes stop_codon:yes gene_type:complete